MTKLSSADGMITVLCSSKGVEIAKAAKSVTRLGRNVGRSRDNLN
jgi:hypothetical protein